MQNSAHLAPLVATLAFALAFVFGAVAHRVSFCTMGSITDIVNFGDWRRMRMWLLAIAIATAIASSHIRIRRQSPKFTMSVIEPIVQKLTRCATAPNTNASANASVLTSGARWAEFCMRVQSEPVIIARR
jgi:uncharacterized membrane protein YedE/YeeE